jgi:hypothetical protein
MVVVPLVGGKAVRRVGGRAGRDDVADPRAGPRGVEVGGLDREQVRVHGALGRRERGERAQPRHRRDQPVPTPAHDEHGARAERRRRRQRMPVQR